MVTLTEPSREADEKIWRILNPGDPFYQAALMVLEPIPAYTAGDVKTEVLEALLVDGLKIEIVQFRQDWYRCYKPVPDIVTPGRQGIGPTTALAVCACVLDSCGITQAQVDALKERDDATNPT